MYRTLSEVKSEIESVIRTGRKVCEDRTTKNPKKLGLGIDALKHLYNALGEHVTKSKNTLEKLLKMSNAFNENFQRIEKWLDQQEQLKKPTVDEENNMDRTSFGDIQILLNQCNELYDEYKQSCEPTYLEDTRRQIDELSSRFFQISNMDVVKNLNELKATLHNLDNISLETLKYLKKNMTFVRFCNIILFLLSRNMEKDLESVDTTNTFVQKLHQQVSDIIKVSLDLNF